MASKHSPVRKAQHAMIVTLEESSKGNLSLVIDAAEKKEGSEPAEWVTQRNFANHEYPTEMMDGLQLTRRELAEIGETLMIWLLAKAGRLND